MKVMSAPCLAARCGAVVGWAADTSIAVTFAPRRARTLFPDHHKFYFASVTRLGYLWSHGI